MSKPNSAFQVIVLSLRSIINIQRDQKNQIKRKMKYSHCFGILKSMILGRAISIVRQDTQKLLERLGMNGCQ